MQLLLLVLDDVHGLRCGEINMRENGSLTAFETGQSTSYALDSIQARGKLFIGPGEAIYENQVQTGYLEHRMHAMYHVS